MQCYRMFLTLLPSRNQYETNPSREQKNAAAFAKRNSYRKITITSLAEVTAVSTTSHRGEHNKRQERKNRYSVCYKKIFVCML